MEKYLKDMKVKFQKVSDLLKSEKDKKILEAHNKYNELIKHISNTQTHLDTEIKKAMDQLKKSATDLEKNIHSYKAKAQSRIDHIEEILLKKADSAKKSSLKKFKQAAERAGLQKKPKAQKMTRKKTRRNSPRPTQKR